jgi:uncharacterized delta-60 repeat protein
LVRLNSDGTLDTTFNNGGSGFDSGLFEIKLQNDGKILVVGYFTTYNGSDCQDRLVRLNTDGTLDTTFNNGGSGFDANINSITIQPDDKILVSGYFNNYNGVDCLDNLVRLNTDGTLDTTFNNGGSGFNGGVNLTRIQSDGKILVSGFFTTYNGADCPDGFVRLNSNGSLDITFNNSGTGFNTYLSKMSIQSDDKIIVSGSFTTYNGADCPDYLVRLNSDGSLDELFEVLFMSPPSINSISLQSDDKIFIGGYFTTNSGINHFMNLNPDGTLNSLGNVKILTDYNGLLKYEDNYHSVYSGRTLVDREYVDVRFDSIISENTLASNGLTKNINTVEIGGSIYKNTTIDGDYDFTLDNKSFNLLNITGGFNYNETGVSGNVVRYLYNQTDSILIGGDFFYYNGIDCPNNLIRVNRNGSLDTTFNNGGSGFDNIVLSIDVQTDGKILVGGNFTTYNGSNCPDRFVRLNMDGTLDTTFNNGGSGFNSAVWSISIQPDGKILVGGQFTSYNGISCPWGLIRLNTDGSLDTTFNNGGSGFVNGSIRGGIIVQPDGKILVGGFFTQYNGINCPDNLVRLNSNGSLDTTFNNGGSGFNSDVYSISIQSDGKILVGGSFTQYNGSNCPDKLIRLNSNGSLDTTFNNGGTGFNNDICTISIQTDGKILAGGDFTTYNGSDCSDRLTRLNTDGSIDNTFIFSGSGVLIYKIIIQLDGKVLMGGLYGSLVRINQNGSQDLPTNVKVFLDKNHGLLRYENNYHEFYTNRTLVDKEYVDLLSSNYLSLSGGTMSGTISFGLNNQYCLSGSGVMAGITFSNKISLSDNSLIYPGYGGTLIESKSSDFISRLSVNSEYTFWDVRGTISTNAPLGTTYSRGTILMSTLGGIEIKYNNPVKTSNIQLTDGYVGIVGVDIYTTSLLEARLKTNSLTDDRDFSFPDSSGTFSLISDFGQLMVYTNATKPAAATNVGRLIYISDIDGGIAAISNGTDWKKMHDNSIIV